MKSLRSYLPESFLLELGEGPNDSGPVLNGSPGRKIDPTNSKFGIRELKIGDPVVVKNMKYEGETGLVDDYADNENFVIVDLKKIGKKKFHISDLEYNDYAGKEEIDADHELNNLRILSGY